MNSSDFLKHMGTDATKWAGEFCRIHGGDEELMLGWFANAIEAARGSEIRIVFDGPPSHESGRFVEVENIGRESIGVGRWEEREDGLWELQIPGVDMNTATTAHEIYLEEQESGET